MSIKQLSFIQNDNNVKFMNNIMKLMKWYKLEVEDVNNIVEKHIQFEIKKSKIETMQEDYKINKKKNNNMIMKWLMI